MSMLEEAIEWLAPAVCEGCGLEGSALCNICAAAEIIPFGERCWNCATLSPGAITCKRCRLTGSPKHVWVVTDYDGLAKILVQKYKFAPQRSASRPLARLMAEALLSFNSTEELKQSNYLIVSIPTASSRVRQRGFDHAALLAKRIAAQTHLSYSQPLRRIGQARQVGTKRIARLAQTKGSYVVHKPHDIIGRKILLIDDVVTTGATLQAASKVLRSAGAKQVDALVFAKRL